MGKILKEPLFHFFLLGAALFIVFGLTDHPKAGGDESILVRPGRIEHLAKIFGKTWQRSPTRRELEALVDDFVLEEIYYRQAVALGIDRGDTVIRRRLRQKLEFLSDDLAAVKPTDEDLAAYLAAHEDQFRRDPTYTFRQVFIDPETPREEVEEQVTVRLTALRAGEVASGGGLTPAFFAQASRRTVDGSFGEGFSSQLDSLAVGDWQGPVESGLGLHLVRLEARQEGEPPGLDEIRPRVEREWAHERRLESRRKMEEGLLASYQVVVQWPARMQEGFREGI